MTAMTATQEQLDIGRVIQELFAVLSRNLVTFGVLALILTGLPSAVANLLQTEVEHNATATGWAWFASTTLIQAVAGLVLQGALIYATIRDLNGRPIRVVDGLAIGMHNLLPLLGVGILYAVAVALGCILLVVPGVMIAVAWVVAVPVLIAERLPVMATFGRSAELTRGNRWRIFGLLLLYVAFFLALTIVTSVANGIASFAADAVPGVLTVQHALLNVVSSVISALIGATGGAVLYVELRRIREGVGHEELATIFD